MNVENLTRLAEVLRSEQADEHFNITTWFTGGTFNRVTINNCGTTACIAGWAALLARPDGIDQCDIRDVAAKFLGLTPDQESDLFLGWPFSDITSAEAADVVDNLIHTGEVDGELVQR